MPLAPWAMMMLGKALFPADVTGASAATPSAAAVSGNAHTEVGSTSVIARSPGGSQTPAAGR
eukprot:1601880-Pleurochrysis_carterae.AAC.6